MRRAFTLVELLVVVSIISVLSAMLLPAIALVRTQARSMNCASQLRQVGMAAEAYSTDNEGLIVPQRDASGSGWFLWLIPYISEQSVTSSSYNAAVDLRTHRSVLHCPEYKTFYGAVATPGYGMREWAALKDGSWVSMAGTPIQINRVKHISNQILAGDSVGFGLRADTDYANCMSDRGPFFTHAGPHDGGATCTREANVGATGGASGSPKRHGSTANWVFFDGHVQALQHIDAARGVGRYASDIP